MSVSSAEPELFIIFQVSILQQQLIRYFRTNTSYALLQLTLLYKNNNQCYNYIILLSCSIFYLNVSFIVTTLLIRAGDIETNPGPKKMKTYSDLIKATENNILNLKYACINFQNLSIKHQEFTKFVNDLDHQSIIGVTETWMNESYSDNNWVIDNEAFKIFRCDRNKELTNKTKGGGVLLLVPQALKPKIREDLNLFTIYENIWIEYQIGPSKKLLNISYCPNKCQMNHFLDELTKNIDNAITENKSITLMGDYNINYLNEDEKEKLDACLIPYGLDVINKKVPTRITENTKTLIDYIISENETTAKYIIADTEFKTDHLLSVCITSTELSKTKPTIKFIHSKKNYVKHSFQNEMETTNWDNIYLSNDINYMFNSFEYKFSNTLNKHAPYIKIFTRNNKVIKEKGWLTDECKILSTEKKELLKEHNTNKTDDSYVKYKQCRNKLNSLLKKSYKEFNSIIFENIRGVRSKWKFINNIRQSKQPGTVISLLKNCFGDKITDPKKLSNYLNYMFTKLGDYKGTPRLPPSRKRYPNKNFSFRFITEGEYLKEMRKINVKKPIGPSKIPSWALKDADKSVSKILTYMINECIKQSCFPNSLKRANIIPVYKKGDTANPINYRPIALTSVLSKVIERLLVGQINDYLAKNKLLSPIQFGFRKKFSTKDALLYATEQFRTDISAGKTVSVALLDLSKAFDSLSHSILKTKLEDMGFTNQAILLILDYLKNRKQRVVVNNTESEWWETNQGVPQGTVLGPLLFLLYVNDMNDETDDDCTIAQYADDTMLFIADKNPENATSRLGNNVDKLVLYFESHKLSINVSKTEFMILCSAKNKTTRANIKSINLNATGSVIKQVDEAKYLGIIFDNNLSFKTQTKKVLKNMATGIKTIYTIRNFVPLQTRLVLLNALVLCHLYYPCVLFSGINNTLMSSLDKQINWAVKACCFKRKYDSSTQLKKSNGILPAQKQIEYMCLTYFWKLVNNQSAAFTNLRFPNFPLRYNERKLCYNINVSAKNQKTDHIKDSFTNQTTLNWNKLPPFIKQEINHKKFKSKLKFYLLEEFRKIPNDRVISRAWDGFRVEFD